MKTLTELSEGPKIVKSIFRHILNFGEHLERTPGCTTNLTLLAIPISVRSRVVVSSIKRFL